MHYFQVALPGLHISLEVFHKFFKALEDECSVLDVKIAEKMAEKEEEAGNKNFQSLAELAKKNGTCRNKYCKIKWWDTISLWCNSCPNFK